MNASSLRTFVAGLVLVSLLTACVYNSPVSNAGESVDNDFNEFISRFSNDTAFQTSRVKFPLKCTVHDIPNDNVSVTYVDESRFETLNYRQTTSAEWTQHIAVDKNNDSATIEFRGNENGIMVKHEFRKIGGKWMLIEIDDSST
jgi:hypothetical protein